MRNRNRNTSFLVELLINVLVFSISCAILVGVFAQASIKNHDNNERNQANVEVCYLLEVIKAEGIQSLPRENIQENGQYIFGYDESWKPVNLEESKYLVVLELEQTESPAGVLHTITAVAKDEKGKEICSFETALYTSGQEGVA